MGDKCECPVKSLPSPTIKKAVKQKNKSYFLNFDYYFYKSHHVASVSCVSKCVVYLFFFVSVEVLLDMSASGSELGWLTLPYESGVSHRTYLYVAKVTENK